MTSCPAPPPPIGATHRTPKLGDIAAAGGLQRVLDATCGSHHQSPVRLGLLRLLKHLP